LAEKSILGKVTLEPDEAVLDHKLHSSIPSSCCSSIICYHFIIAHIQKELIWNQNKFLCCGDSFLINEESRRGTSRNFAKFIKEVV